MAQDEKDNITLIHKKELAALESIAKAAQEFADDFRRNKLDYDKLCDRVQAIIDALDRRIVVHGK